MVQDSLTPPFSRTALAAQTICEDVLLEKYAKAGEVCAADVYARVARGLASVEVMDPCPTVRDPRRIDRKSVV